MEKKEMLKNGTDLVYLARCALAGETPKSERLETMDLEAVHALAKRHSMVAVSAYAMESYCKENPDSAIAQHPVTQVWRQDKIMAIRKNLMLDMERESILAYLEQIGCWYMPLKGVFMQRIYPRAGMRQMSDNDILIDPAFRKEIRAYMLQNGYKADDVGQSVHDEYMKQPVYHYEMHIALLDSIHHSGRVAYYRNIKEKLRKDPENAFGYHFSDEDFYLYMHVHAAKHFEGCGNGIRSLMDIYQYLSQKGAQLDRESIEPVLEQMGLKEYVDAMEKLSGKLFGANELLTEQEQEVFFYLISSDTYGKKKTWIENKMKEYVAKDGKVTFWSRVRYAFRRFYPKAEFYEYRMPLVYKYRILMPFAAVWRLIVSLFTRFPMIAKEVKRVFQRK